MTLPKWILVLFIAISIINEPAYSLPAAEKNSSAQIYERDLIESEQQIRIPGYPNAFNPSIIQIPQGYLLTFRHLPDERRLWISNIGIILLNESLVPISEPMILNMRGYKEMAPSQAEDARIFALGDRLFLIYNDNIDITNPGRKERRDMYLAEIVLQGSQFHVKKPVKIIHEEQYAKETWQKNWMPFVFNDQILIIYGMRPHEIIIPNLKTGVCKVICSSIPFFSWRWGALRGGTPALLVDGVYLAFFHSSMLSTIDAGPKDKEKITYFMGAYTFSQSSPFEIISISQKPIMSDQFYSDNEAPKKVIFPGGFAVAKDKILLAYGRNDKEIWIASFDKKHLMNSLLPVSNNIIIRPEAQNSSQIPTQKSGLKVTI